MCSQIRKGHTFVRTGATYETGTRKQSEQLIYPFKSPSLFSAHCAESHGSDGKGNGPKSFSLKTKPADLTAVAKITGGRSPIARMQKAIQTSVYRWSAS